MYNTETKIISAPVGLVADIATALGVGSGDLGYLCSNQHGKTNKWSRFKPIRRKGLDLHLLADYENGGTLYKGLDGQCGLSIPYTTSLTNSTSAAKYFDGEMKWQYNAPEPNSTYPARALDFDGYFSAAVPPFSEETIDTVVNLEQTGDQVKFMLGWDIAVTSGEKYNLSLYDINVPVDIASSDNESLSDWYLGLLMRNRSNRILAATSQNTLDVDGGLSIEFYSTNEDIAGEWEVVPFMCPEQVTINSADFSSKYVGIDVNPVWITVRSAGELTYGLLSAYWIEPEEDTQYRYIGYEGFIKNYDSSSKEIRFRISAGYSETGEPWADMTNTVYAGSSDGYTITVPAANDDGSPAVVTFNSSDMGGVYPIIDIGSVYLDDENSTSDGYWTVVHISATGQDNWNAPQSAYVPIEEPVKEG